MNNLFSRQLLKSVCFTLMACLVLYSNAEEKEWPREKQLWNQYSIVKGNTELEITKLQDLMKYYFHGVSNMTKGDSVSNLCLRIAYESNKQDHILAAYEAYFNSYAQYLRWSKKWMKECNRLLFVDSEIPLKSNMENDNLLIKKLKYYTFNKRFKS